MSMCILSLSIAVSSPMAETDSLPAALPRVETINRLPKVDLSAYRHTLPVHVAIAPSPLSKEAPPESYRGFVNLGMLLLFGNNIRLIIENYLKYGILISFPGSSVSKGDWTYTALTHIILPLNVLIAFSLEAWARKRAIGYRKRRSETIPQPGAVAAGDFPDPKLTLQTTKRLDASARLEQSIVGWLHALNATAILVWPSIVTYYYIFHPFMAMSCVIAGCIQFFKMTSYALVNHDFRAAYIFDKPREELGHVAKVHSDSVQVTNEEVYQYDIQYPDNITLKNMSYFWLAPTLCYQPSYPQTKVFRKSFFFKRVLEILTCLGMMYFLTEQYATPTLRNSVQAFDQLAVASLVERVLKMSTTSVIIWLLMFYTVFHSCFNALAEFLYFGDRHFYRSWWNAGNLQTYWKTWNLPMYTFFKRHAYLPMITSGVHPLVASIIVFTISALLHEVVIGFPTHMLLGYAFAGMMCQIPLIAITQPLEKWRGPASGLGNMIFWVSFTIVGQPACAMLYYYHWTKRNMDASASSV
ncbi:hypothetical protein BGW38_007047 [Lunasporangiospora selenospora]|uniref:O-acyltransferase n=1 Tax=Lunasporangiospora selenospora TaxID=979761 RepID=A0A9P6KGP5_9FUNG|nr:hypothetical protein BGW38_007047 [Lunasporangiospora selenospora]